MRVRPAVQRIDACDAFQEQSAAAGEGVWRAAGCAASRSSAGNGGDAEQGDRGGLARDRCAGKRGDEHLDGWCDGQHSQEGWKEVKLVTVSAVRHQLDAMTGKPIAHLRDHSYRAGLWDGPNSDSSSGRKPVAAVWRKSTISAVSMTAQPGSGTSCACAMATASKSSTGGMLSKSCGKSHSTTSTQNQSRRPRGSPPSKQLLMEGRLRVILRNIRLLYPRGHVLPDPVRKAMLISSTIAGVCATISAAAPSNRPANMSSNRSRYALVLVKSTLLAKQIIWDAPKRWFLSALQRLSCSLSSMVARWTPGTR